MTCRVVLIESEEGFAAFCPAFPGCASQGATEFEALEHIREAAALWLETGGVVAADEGAASEAELLREAAEDDLTVRIRQVGMAVAA